MLLTLTQDNAKIIKHLNISHDAIGRTFRKNADNFIDFINGNGEFKTTIAKLRQLAKISNIPFSYLFLKELPTQEKPIADFRGNNGTYSQALIDSINDSLKKQEWYRNLLLKEFVDKFLHNKTYNTDTDIINEIKNITKFDRKKDFAKLKAECENNGIIVLVSGICAGNTRAAILLEECRGYAIHDEYAPLIFINTRDGENGKIFTLLHELAHILLQKTGVSSYDFNQAIEYRCNNIAGEILLPSDEFKNQWNNENTLKTNIEHIKNKFKIVSNLAIATKALLCEFISPMQYKIYKDELMETFILNKNNQVGGNYYNNLISANSKIFTESVIVETINGNLTFREGMQMLNIHSLDKFDKLIEKMAK